MPLTLTLVCTTTMVWDTMVLDIPVLATMEGRRGRLRLRQRLSQRLRRILRLTHGCCMEDMEAMDTLTMLL